MSKLQYLKANCSIEDTQQTIDVLCQLKHIETLSFRLDGRTWNEKNLGQLEKTLRHHCTNIKILQLNTFYSNR